ncbi:MAG: flippase-like domain-containing protein [Bacteroidales bacterium]|nr:flippase-like domain-containing protein [Bacteroidales bacterium]
MGNSDSQNNGASTVLSADEGKKKSLVGLLLRYLVPLAITVLLVWYMFTKINFSELWQTIRHGVDYRWILLAMGISVLSHIFRALRWRLQLVSLEIKPPLLALCCSIFGTYALNLVFPRLGEVWRCSYIAQRQKAPFTKVLGSMVADRLSDTLMVLMLLLFTLVVAHDKIMAFLNKYPVGQGLLDMLSSPWFWIAVVGCLVLVVVVFRAFREKGPVKKILHMLTDLWHGFASVGRMKGKWMFLIYTFAIWGCYFFQLYVAFYAFECTRVLCFESGTVAGLLPCLVAFVLSSIGMAVPSNGGLGPWNMAIVFGLMLYNVPEAPATSMSIVVWSAQTVMLIALGIFTAIYIAGGKKDSHPSLRQDIEKTASL